MHNIKYLRVIVTEKCNLNCFFCHKEGAGFQDSKEINQDEMLQCIDVLLHCGIKKVKIMGGEPTLYPALDKVIAQIRQKSPELDISMITNGIVSKEKIDQCMEAGLNRINVSLHGFDIQHFKEITKGNAKQLASMMDTILHLKEKSMLGKVNYVVLKGENETEFFDVLRFIQKNNIVLDILNYLSDKDEDIYKFYYSFDEIRQMIIDKYEIVEEQKWTNSNSIDSWRLYLKGGGVINLKINQLNKFNFLKNCSNCPKIVYCKEGIAAIRLTSNGLIKPCLFREDLKFDLIGYLNTHTFDETVSAVGNYLENL